MTITTRLYTFFNGRLVGIDQFGNRYFTQKRAPKEGRARRWVLYKGLAEPSKVPPEWHGWLHYTLDVPLAQRHIPRWRWIKPHLPNLTGTPNAWRPPGHLLKGAHREQTTSDYEAWRP